MKTKREKTGERMKNSNTKISQIVSKNKVLFQNISGSFLLKIISLAISFLITPAYIRYFGNQTILGVWFTMLSILNWILNFDFGIGNGLRNHLVQALKDNNRKEIKRQISSAYIALGIICLVIFIGGMPFIEMIDWNKMLNVSTQVISTEVLANSVKIVFAGIVLQLWLRIITSICYAAQKVIEAGMCALLTNVGLLIFVCTFKGENAEQNLLNLSIAYGIAVILPLIGYTIKWFCGKLSDSKPSYRYFNKIAARNIVSLGGKFFIIQLCLLVINATNQWLIIKLATPENVVDYQLYYKVFEIAPVVFALFTQPIWSAVTTALSENRLAWIRKSYCILNMIALLGTGACACVAYQKQTQ